MHTFEVWAPRPDRVELVLQSGTNSMREAEGGWWKVPMESAGPGTLYSFSLGGGPLRPDPRSAFQPEGVDGPSQVVDHGAFRWTDGSWAGHPLPGSVLYELHVGTFSPEGTFDGAITRLPHLVELGIDTVELLPVAEFPGSRGWGYDGADLFAPHHAYGGPEGLKRLVNACHGAGLAVVLDVVYNHLGPAGNYLPEFGPYFSERHTTNWGAAVNFDGPDSLEVRRFVIDNALMWLRDYHFDGLRLDAVHAIVDHSAIHVLEQMAAEVSALSAGLGRPLFLVAESDLNDPRFVRHPQAGGHGLDASWADEWHHALHAALTGEQDGYYQDFGPIELLAKAMKQAWVYDGTYSPYRRRVHGRPVGDLAGHRFVVSTQNHDQVGNRALGERSSALMSEGRLKVAAALLIASPFVPLLFQGEEWAAGTPFLYFTDHTDPDLGKAVSEGRRKEFASFGWDPDQVPDPQDPATFERSKLDWSEPAVQPHARVLAWYRQILSLLHTVPSLNDHRRDRVEVDYDEEAGWLAVRRPDVLAVANIGSSGACVPHGGVATLLAASDPAVVVSGEAVEVPPDAAAFLGR